MPRECVWNADESGYALYATRGHTLEERGSADAAVNNAHEKAQVTVMETMTAAGPTLERFIIFGGKTDRVLPPNHATTPGKYDMFLCVKKTA